jgi:hypothetical protein
MRLSPHDHNPLIRVAAAGMLVSWIAPPTVAAQQLNTSAAAAGLGGNFTARARGYDAVAWNPANLGLPGNPGFSLAILPASASFTLDPITLGDIKSVQNQKAPNTVSRTTRQEWLDKVTAAGGEKGTPSGGTSIALSAGPFALQLGMTFFGTVNLNPDAVQAILFGNVAPDGTVRTLSFKNSKYDGGGVTTAALSYGHAFGQQKAGSGILAFGATVKMIGGNIVSIGRDAGSNINANGGTISFPSVGTRSFQDCHDDTGQIKPGCTPMTGPGGFNGNGFGADIGVSWLRDKLGLSAAIQNVFNTFAWDESGLSYRPGSGQFDVNGDTTDFDQRPFANAPAALKSAIANYKLRPTISAGLAYDATKWLTISADARQQMADDQAIAIGPKTSVGAGVEYRGIPMLSLRGGADYITGGTAFSVGAGLRFGRYELGAAIATQQGDNKGTSVFVNLFSLNLGGSATERIR